MQMVGFSSGWQRLLVPALTGMTGGVVGIGRRTGKGGEGAIRKPQQVLTEAVLYKLGCLCQKIRIGGIPWLNLSRREYQSDNARIVHVGFILPHRSPAGAVSHEYEAREALPFGEVDPRRDVPDLMAGYSPNATATNPFSQPWTC